MILLRNVAIITFTSSTTDEKSPSPPVYHTGVLLNAAHEVELKIETNTDDVDVLLASLRQSGINVEVIECESQLILIPGLVDVHMHVTGGGGESGFASRVPEARFSDIVTAGITSVVGILGTDGVSRSPEGVLAKCRGLEAEGLRTCMWTGSYSVPVRTITGSVQRDITIVDKIIGVGELAVADHRGSQPTLEELARIASDAHVAGILTGKAGVVHVHMGAHTDGMELLRRVIDTTALPIRCLYPTHVNIRGDSLVREAIEWLQRGGYVDVTAGRKAAACLQAFARANVNMRHVTLSSDAYGSCPRYDDDGNLLSYGYKSPEWLLKNIHELVHEYAWPLARAISLCTTNPTEYLRLSPNNDWMLVRVDDEAITPQHMWIRGKRVMTHGKAISGFLC